MKLPKAGLCAIVIFGATGDLTSRKLMPAIFSLARQGCLPKKTVILCVGREPMADGAFRQKLRTGVEKAHEGSVSATAWRAFASRLHYMAVDLTAPAAYRELAERLDDLGAGEAGLGNHMFYLAVPPFLAPDIVHGLGASGLSREDEGWSRIVIEKPFGNDRRSAQALNRTITAVFDEDQVYRIDHFLGKETVQNLLTFRFGNTLFEPVWNRNYVDHVQITVAETLGIGRRAGFYEESGALRDVIANHCLQLLTLTAMEPPVAYEAGAVREEKVQVLRSIRPMTRDEVAERAVRGQYRAGSIGGRRVRGYRGEPGVARTSMTETYAAVEYRIDNWRWAGVPFYLRTGKRLSGDLTEIAIHFRRTPQALFARTDSAIAQNVVAFGIQPDEGIGLTFSAKVPGEGMRTERVRMEFDYEKTFDTAIPAAYETLLLDVLQGDPTLFTRGDEAEAQWALTDPIVRAWAADGGEGLHPYRAGSAGPAAADALLARNGHAWRALPAAPGARARRRSVVAKRRG